MAALLGLPYPRAGCLHFSPAAVVSLQRDRNDGQARVMTTPMSTATLAAVASTNMAAATTATMAVARRQQWLRQQQAGRDGWSRNKSRIEWAPCPPFNVPTNREEQRKVKKCQRGSKILAYYGLTTPPYKLDALEPYMSQKTLELHWGRHHRDLVDSLNKQLAKSPLYGYTMEELIKVTFNNGNPLPEFNNTAEVWNHDFFWESMQPDGGNLPWGGLLQQIEKDFGSFSRFKEDFLHSAIAHFGSGWVWLVLKTSEKKLSVVRTSNAICPLVWGDIPIISLDMWEHAYYLDYKYDREKYVNTFLDHLVSWHAATARIVRAEAFVNLGEPKIPVA